MNNDMLKQFLGFEEDTDHHSVTISISSPETILSWSRGEVKTPETINYRSLKPEKGGLFCERIFGPTRDWECNCGRYKRMKHKGIVCDHCGVEVTQSRVRRERMGHITLASPVAHIWFSKCTPSRLGLMLDMTVRELERVIYYERWIITDPGDTPLERKALLDDDHYREARDLYGDSFKAGMGAEALENLLKQVDLDALRVDLEKQTLSTKSKANRKKIAKRMRLVEGFLHNSQRPEWMVLRVLPVIPPDLRPLVPLEGGRFASSDLNDLYRRVINRNNRLRNLLNLRTPEVIIRNEKRMLQEAVDALLDNGRHGRPVTGTNNRPLKSLSDMLKGKQGRFRQNLLGKRVDYSGRSVIVVGPFLKLHQAGLPKEMALTLFEPFIMRRLKELGYVHTVRSAKKMIERKASVVWDILEEVTKGHPILLNRAPTLHRLSIQAFEPVLIEGKAIRLHPLVCAAYNADFDGDQMAVHVPLSNEAQLESRLLMLAPNNIFSPANGKPITTPSQDITLGAYYLTYEGKEFREALIEHRQKKPFTGRTFTGYHEALAALNAGAITLHQPVRIPNPDFGKEPFPPVADREQAKHKLLITTAGRCIFNEIWPHGSGCDIGFYNQQAGKKQLGALIKVCYDVAGRDRVILLLDDLKDLGYYYAMKSGISMAIKDMIIPDVKAAFVQKAEDQISVVRKQRLDGVITETERYNKCIDIWTQCNSDLANELIKTLKDNAGKKEINPVYAMLDSGARGSRDQIRQLAGMRGLMAKPTGEIIERPILANFREGLSVLEYFISSHGARKGLADTALKTADSGYMTRKLVDAAHDVICVEQDCGTLNGITTRGIGQGDEIMVPLKDRIVGRFSVNDIYSTLAPDTIICRASEEITPEIAAEIDDCGIEEVMLRSVLTCESKNGICAKCYGRHLATGNLPEEGDSLGIIAAQSIGEPGTQLTMRTFHIGGAAASSFKKPELQSKIGGKLRFEDVRCVEAPGDPALVDSKKIKTLIVLNKNGIAILEDDEGNEVERFDLVMGTTIFKHEGAKITKDEIFARWDPYNSPIIAKSAGKLKFLDLIEGVTMRRERNEASGNDEMTVLEHREDLHPQLIVADKKGHEEHYLLPAGAHIMFGEGTATKEGDTIAKVPRQQQKNKDITGGLPRVAELFEARRPKEAAELARIDGTVEFGEIKAGRRRLTVSDPETGKQEEHNIPATKRVTVFNGDFVRKGQSLTDGNIVPQELLDVCGPRALQEYLVNQVQEVYRLQGVEINDKHVEIIVRQMMRKVRIAEPGDSRFLYGETIDRNQFLEENARILAEGGRSAEAQPVLLGITKASLETESFISAASFQDTTRVLTEAATQGRIDYLRGFKENVIMGQLIPAGTGYCGLAGARVVRHGADDFESAEPKTEADKAEEARQMLGL